jgi:hypothetical protein
VAPCVEATTGQLGLYPLVLLRTAGGRPSRVARGRMPSGIYDGGAKTGAVVGEVICPTSGRSCDCAVRKSSALCRLSSSRRYRATLASHYCELSHCGVTAAAYAADSVFSARNFSEPDRTIRRPYAARFRAPLRMETG